MVCQKCFIDTNKILELAKKTQRLFPYAQVGADMRAIIKAIEEPLAGLPRTTIETTISRRVIRTMQTDVLGYLGVLCTGTGGYNDNRWYRLSLPRGFALRVLAELEDTWLHGPDANTRTMFRRAYKTLQRALGV